MAISPQGLANQGLQDIELANQLKQISEGEQTKQQSLLEGLTTEANKDTFIDNTDLVNQIFSSQLQPQRANPFSLNTTSGGQTTPFFDILQAAASSYAPQQSPVFQQQATQELAKQAAKVKASQELFKKLISGTDKTLLDQRIIRKAQAIANSTNKDFTTKLSDGTDFIARPGSDIAADKATAIADGKDEIIRNLPELQQLKERKAPNTIIDAVTETNNLDGLFVRMRENLAAVPKGKLKGIARAIRLNKLKFLNDPELQSFATSMELFIQTLTRKFQGGRPTDKDREIIANAVTNVAAGTKTMEAALNEVGELVNLQKESLSNVSKGFGVDIDKLIQYDPLKKEQPKEKLLGQKDGYNIIRKADGTIVKRRI